MSVVFLGTSEFAAGILERLAGDAALRPALVVTRPDRPSGRGRRLTAPPVAERARTLGLELAQPEDVNSPQARAQIAAAPGAAGNGAVEPGAPARHTVVVCAFGALLKEPLISEHEMINVHPSLLPRWRGAAPIERAIMAGDSETGVAIMRLTAGLDSGPVCLTGSEPITPADTYGTLAARLELLGGELLVRALRDSPAFVEQPEHGVTYAEKVLAADRLLDPARPATELERVVRALTPHIGARLALGDGALLGVRGARVYEAGGAEEPGATTEAGGADEDGATTEAGVCVAPAPARPGEVFEHAGRLLLACTPGLLELIEVQPPGSRPMDGAAYLRGHGVPPRL